ncbi:MAG: antibiotic biosynthesis monooxygenase [Trebonia sp.]
MFVHLAIHYPRPEYADDVLASMHCVDEAAEGSRGLIRMGAWRDENSNRLVGLAMWESREAYEAAAERIFQVVADDAWDQWCERPIDVFRLTQP